MNYYNPYYFMQPINTPQRIGLFSRLFGNSRISFGGIINGTQKALNLANQTIPLVKQVKPIIGNAKTMFKVMNEFKKNETPKANNINYNSKKNVNEEIITKAYDEYNGPTFFA